VLALHARGRARGLGAIAIATRAMVACTLAHVGLCARTIMIMI
jgi:hypothetical protein